MTEKYEDYDYENDDVRIISYALDGRTCSLVINGKFYFYNAEYCINEDGKTIQIEDHK